MKPVTEPNGTWHMGMWIDLGRGANVLRCEWLRGGRLKQRTQVLEWKQFNDRAGKLFWLPVQSVWDSFVTERLNEYARTPTYRESFKLLEETVALNMGLRADSLEVTFDPKTKIVDLTAPQPPAVPAELRPTGPRLTTETVEKTLRQAKEQRAELLQRASQRQVRTDWTGWIAMGLALLGLGVLLAAWYFRRLHGG